jgi:23S rRNA (cytosine1962-C5)-methyltransferase
MGKIILKSGKDQSLRRHHPWVFSGAIKKIHGHPAEGALVKVYSNRDEFLGVGHYQSGSIAVRIISWEDRYPDMEFWQERIRQAVEYRRLIGIMDNPEINVFRLVNAEGDGLPGLIADFYNGTVVLQFHSRGMYHVRNVIAGALQELFGNKLVAVYDKSESTLSGRSEEKPANSYLTGKKQPVEVVEYGNVFRIDTEKGQKTGFFIDQRENRKLVGQYSRGKTVLNLFGYTGGFSVYALRGGARSVDTVDSSEAAIALSEENISLNGLGQERHHPVVAEAFDYLKGIKDTYDLMVLDPPAFAKHQQVMGNALQGYKRLNALAMERIKAGGILFTFSCSQAVSKEHFRKAVFAAAAGTGKTVRILHQLHQPPDHPVSIYHPEGEYLKGLVLHVGGSVL